MDLNITAGAYNLEAPVAVQECINMFPEIEKDGSQSRRILRRFPGLKSVSDPSNGAIRGIKRMSGVPFAVAGDTLYSFDINGNSTSIGTIIGDGLVSMATDGVNLVIVNGGVTGYVYDGTTLSVISDPDFVSSSKVLFLDTYFVHLRPDTNQFFISESGSATSYIATDRATKEGQPGNIQSIITSNRDLILGGEETTEFWRVQVGAIDFPFIRQEGTFQERGFLGLNSPVEMDNDVFYLGDDKVVYQATGNEPVRISHHAIEKWIDEQTREDVENAIGMTTTYQGHYWYILSFRLSTWVYDSTTSLASEQHEWFQLESLNEMNWRVGVM